MLWLCETFISSQNAKNYKLAFSIWKGDASIFP